MKLVLFSYFSGMNKLASLLESLKGNPSEISFENTISTIDDAYQFSPTSFKNGELLNEANQNNGSCKIFAFAKVNQIDKEATLHLFGDYYRIDVLKNPTGEDHQNIRNFIKFGWDGIVFNGEALEKV